MALSKATNDSDAALLENSDIVSRVRGEEEELGIDTSQFEPEVTNEDLEREERELAEQEEAAAVYALSFPVVPSTPPVEPPTEPEPEEEERALPAPSVADDRIFILNDTLAIESSSLRTLPLPRTPLSPFSPTKQSPRPQQQRQRPLLNRTSGSGASRVGPNMVPFPSSTFGGSSRKSSAFRPVQTPPPPLLIETLLCIIIHILTKGENSAPIRGDVSLRKSREEAVGAAIPHSCAR